MLTKSTGLKLIDDDHDALSYMFENLINESNQNNIDAAQLVVKFKVFWNYTIRHFKLEENLALSSAYPYYQDLKDSHDLFIESLEDIIYLITSNDFLTFDKIKTIQRVLINWFNAHNETQDIRLAEYLLISANNI